MSFFNFKEVNILKKNLEELQNQNEVLKENLKKLSDENKSLTAKKTELDSIISASDEQIRNIQNKNKESENLVNENKCRLRELETETERLLNLRSNLADIILKIEQSDFKFRGKKFTSADYLMAISSEEKRESVEIAAEKTAAYTDRRKAVEELLREFFSPSLLFKFREDGEGYVLTEYIGKNTEKVVIPRTYKGKKVTALDKFDMFNGIFSYNNVIKEVVILADIEEIPSYTFSYCENLCKVSFSSSVRNIGDYAFSKCRKLSEVEFNPELRLIGKYAFADCDALKSVSLNDGLEIIDEFAFSCCDNITKLNLPKSLKRLYTLGCPNLKKIYFNSKDTFLGENPFHFINQYNDFISDQNFSSGFYEKKVSEFIIPKNLTVYCKRGSEACDYALKNGINLKYIDN